MSTNDTTYPTVYVADVDNAEINEMFLVEGTVQDGWVMPELLGAPPPVKSHVNHTTAATTLEDAEWLLLVGMESEWCDAQMLANWYREKIDEFLADRPAIRERMEAFYKWNQEPAPITNRDLGDEHDGGDK